MFKIAICDDELAMCGEIETIILKHAKSFKQEIITDVFVSGVELCDFLKKGEYFDLIFLDIEMDDLSGIEVGEIIRNTIDNQTMQIVYVSWKENYAMELFKVRPFDFLIKPLEAKEVIAVITKASQMASKMDCFFECTFGGTHYITALKDILYFESQARKVSIFTSNGNYNTHDKLAEIQKKINDRNFVMVHRSYFINFSHVIKYSYEQIVMSNDEIISISQSKRKEIRKYFVNRGSSDYDI